MKAPCRTLLLPRSRPDRPLPKLDATMMLDTKQAREKLADKNAPSAGSGPLGISRPAWMADPFADAKDRIGMLNILEGKTDQEKYVLTGKMTMIGKSSMASIKLKRFFAPDHGRSDQQARQQIFHLPFREQGQAEDQRGRSDHPARADCRRCD